MPARELVIKSVKHNLKVDLVGYYLVSLLVYKLFTWKKGNGQGQSESEEEENEVKQLGWVNLRMQGPSPTWKQQVVKVMLGYFVYDAMF